MDSFDSDAARHELPDGSRPAAPPPPDADGAAAAPLRYQPSPADQAEVTLLLDVLPVRLRAAVLEAGAVTDLIEIVMDLGRPAEIRRHEGARSFPEIEVSQEDLDQLVARIGDFGEDNRAGIARTLHRISAIRNRKGRVIGLTLRVGRAVFGTVEIIRDLIMAGRSVLLLGRPGVGKTTMLRETARLLADSRRVVIVDTSNEIAGDGDIPHPAIGRARRMQVALPSLQHEVMIEAVENHNPEVIVIDEIGRELEALAARTIAERGVQLIGTAHGRSLENVLMNPTLSDLVGGIESVTLSDEEARRRGTQKSVLERRAPPTFDVVVEIQDWHRLVLHHDTALAIDALLRGRPLRPELRYLDEAGRPVVEEGDPLGPIGRGERGDRDRPADRDAGRRGGGAEPAWRERRREGRSGRRSEGPPEPGRDPAWGSPALGYGADQVPAQAPAFALGQRSGEDRSTAGRLKTLRLLPYGVSQNRLRRSAKALGVPIFLTEDLEQADALITLKGYYRKQASILHEAEERRVPIYVLRSNTYAQIEAALVDLFGLRPARDAADAAMAEAEMAIQLLRQGRRDMVELAPQGPELRREQHALARQANLRSLSRGEDPFRRVRLYREGG